MLTAKLATGQRAEDLRELANRCEAWRKEWAAVEPEARALRQALDRRAPGHAAPPTPGLARLLEFLDWNLDYLDSLEGHVAALSRTADQDRQVIGKLVDDLLEDSKKLLLLPFATLAAPFPKLVRDLCRDQGKEADLVIRGEEVEIDKRILEEMKDPLIHLLRNCVDHGIETPEARRRAGKPSRATITLAASQVNGSKVELLVSDDGAGIDADKVKESAVEHGVLSPDAARQLGDAEALRADLRGRGDDESDHHATLRPRAGAGDRAREGRKAGRHRLRGEPAGPGHAFLDRAAVNARDFSGHPGRGGAAAVRGARRSMSSAWRA